MGPLVVSVPGGSQVFLATQVPHLQLQVLVLDLFHVASNRRLRHNHLIKGQFVENGSLSGIVHANNDDLKLDVAAAEPT